MKIFGYDFKATRVPQASSHIGSGSTISSLLDSIQGGYYNRSILLSGENRLLTRDLAVSYAAVYRCATLIASAIAGLPLQVMERKSLKLVEPSDSPPGRVADLFEQGISKEMTNFTFLESMIMDTTLDGNSFMRIHKDSVGRLEELELSIPTNTNIQRAENRALVYGLYFDDGNYQLYPYNEVVHIMMPRAYRRVIGSGHNIRRNFGVAPAQAVSEAVAIGLQGDRYVSDYFNKDIKSNLIFKPEGQLNTGADRDQVTAMIKGYQRGSREPLILSNIDVQEIDNTAQSKELLGLREFQVQEIARAFGVPSPLIGVGVTQWGSGIEQLSRLFVRYCINPYLERIESTLTAKLLPRGFIAKFDVAELTRGDFATMGGFLRNALGGAGVQGVITVNEARKQYLAMPPKEGGDDLFILSNPEFKEPAEDKEEKKDDENAGLSAKLSVVSP